MLLHPRKTASTRQHLIWFVLVMVGLLSLTAISHTTTAQTNTVTITSFQTAAPNVSRQLLADRAARLPVTWSVANRPITANLYFEQFMPQTGEYVNVELPRPWTWVNSAGDGIVNPLVPYISGDTVELRLSVVSWLNGQVLAERLISIPIVDAPPTITRYTALTESVPANLLQSRGASVPVRWDVSNRPADSNLVFEQIMPNGEVRNVEFPRPDPFVNSNGIGALNPYYPGDGVETLRFQLRLINLATNNALAVREMQVAISNEVVEPRISRFESSAVSVNRAALINGTANIPVFWTVENRPADTNLFFEQVMPDGSRRNAEFPRPNPYVASNGSGAVRPVLPTGTTNRVEINVRLQDLQTGITLTSSSLFLDIIGATNPVAALTVTPLIAQPGDIVELAWDIPNVNQVRIMQRYQQNGAQINEPIYQNNGYQAGSDAIALQLPTNVSGDGLTYYISEPTNISVQPVTVTFGDIQVNDFTVTPTTAKAGDTVELSWQTSGTPAITFWMESPAWTQERVVPGTDNPPLTHQGVTSVQIPADAANSITFLLRPAGSQRTAASLTVTLTQEDCVYPWLAALDQGSTCADTAPNSAQAAYQPFERGFMVWRDGQIWVFPNGGNHPQVTDTYTGGPVTWPESPPEGLHQPINGFGTAWVNTSSIREVLGWATAPEQSYTMQYHSGPATINGTSGRMMTFTLPDDRAVRAFFSGQMVNHWTVGTQ